jgi:hypothetical protein
LAALDCLTPENGAKACPQNPITDEDGDKRRLEAAEPSSLGDKLRDRVAVQGLGGVDACREIEKGFRQLVGGLHGGVVAHAVE